MLPCEQIARTYISERMFRQEQGLKYGTLQAIVVGQVLLAFTFFSYIGVLQTTACPFSYSIRADFLGARGPVRRRRHVFTRDF